MGDVLEAHARVLEPRQLRGVLSEAGIASAVARPFIGNYRTAPARAAALAHGLIKNHPFADGNKRAAFAVMCLFLERSGFRFTDPERIDREIADVLVAVANSDMSQAALREWLHKNIVRKVP